MLNNVDKSFATSVSLAELDQVSGDLTSLAQCGHVFVQVPSPDLGLVQLRKDSSGSPYGCPSVYGTCTCPPRLEQVFGDLVKFPELEQVSGDLYKS